LKPWQPHNSWPRNSIRLPARRCWGWASRRWQGELAGKQLEKIYVVEHELLKEYTPDAYTSALRQLLAQVKPDYVLLPHTYQVRDFLPKLATALGTVAVSDVVAHRVDSGRSCWCASCSRAR
jgi:electron transfer flavoprotein alpha subunit